MSFVLGGWQPYFPSPECYGGIVDIVIRRQTIQLNPVDGTLRPAVVSAARIW